MYGHHNAGVGVLVVPVNVGNERGLLQKSGERRLFGAVFVLNNAGHELFEVVEAILFRSSALDEHIFVTRTLYDLFYKIFERKRIGERR